MAWELVPELVPELAPELAPGTAGETGPVPASAVLPRPAPILKRRWMGRLVCRQHECAAATIQSKCQAERRATGERATRASCVLRGGSKCTGSCYRRSEERRVGK